MQDRAELAGPARTRRWAGVALAVAIAAAMLTVVQPSAAVGASGARRAGGVDDSPSRKLSRPRAEATTSASTVRVDAATSTIVFEAGKGQSNNITVFAGYYTHPGTGAVISGPYKYLRDESGNAITPAAQANGCTQARELRNGKSVTIPNQVACPYGLSATIRLGDGADGGSQTTGKDCTKRRRKHCAPNEAQSAAPARAASARTETRALAQTAMGSTASSDDAWIGRIMDEYRGCVYGCDDGGFGPYPFPGDLPGWDPRPRGDGPPPRSILDPRNPPPRQMPPPPPGRQPIVVDFLEGGNGNDHVACGSPTGCFLYGGDGDDKLFGSSSGNDIISGGDGNDQIEGFGGSDMDVFDGGYGDDFIRNHSRGLTYGGPGNDDLGGVTTVYGNDGDDKIWAAWGSDVDRINLVGGPGADRLLADPPSYGKGVVHYYDSNEDVTVGIGNRGHGGTADGDWVDPNIRGIVGSDHYDTLTGNQNDNLIDGSFGDDIIDGGNGNDTLEGYGGHDGINGGDGNDIVRGGDGEDVLDGDAGNDVLTDGPDDDILHGGPGADVFRCSGGLDTISYARSEQGVGVAIGGDRSQNNGGDATGDAVSYKCERLEGSDHNDVISGDRHRNTIDGRDGNDIIIADDNKNTFDTVNCGGGNDAVVVGRATWSGCETIVAGRDSMDTTLANIRNRETGSIDGDYLSHRACNERTKPVTGCNTASGAYQYINPTWRGLLGPDHMNRPDWLELYDRAWRAPKDVQDAVAAYDVGKLLERYGGDLSKLPLHWYHPPCLTNPALMDTVPNPEAGNTLTCRQYQERWLEDYKNTSKILHPNPPTPDPTASVLVWKQEGNDPATRETSAFAAQTVVVENMAGGGPVTQNGHEFSVPEGTSSLRVTPPAGWSVLHDVCPAVGPCSSGSGPVATVTADANAQSEVIFKFIAPGTTAIVGGIKQLTTSGSTDPALVAEVNAQRVTVSDGNGSQSGAAGFLFANVTTGLRTVNVTKPAPDWGVEYTICIDNSTCHAGQTKQWGRSITRAIAPGQIVHIMWYFTPPAPAAGTVAVTSTGMSYIAAAGQANDVTVSSDASYAYVEDVHPLTPVAPHCSAVTATRVRCSRSAITANATVVRLGDGNDKARIDGPIPTTVHGEAGDDSLIGQNAPSPVTFFGGDGIDATGFAARTRAVTVTIDDIANDGEPGEGRNVRSDVENINGSPYNDTITGSAAANQVTANDGDDTVSGGAGDDNLFGGNGNDVINGNGGHDTVNGDDGVDGVNGGVGNDTVIGGPGIDGIVGDDGNDILDADDDTADFGINCGAGYDEAKVDPYVDTLIAECETTNVPPPSGTQVRVTGGTMTYTAAAGQANNVTVTQDGDWVYLNDNVNLWPVAPCMQNLDATKVKCPKSAITNPTTPVVISLGDGNDFAQASGGSRVTVNGDAGDDTFDGVVTLVVTNGPATFAGGTGYDRALYGERTNAVNVSLNDLADDGEGGETDNIASDVERIETGRGNDTIAGSATANDIYANDGIDTITGGGGNDYIEGNAGNDVIDGNGGNDNLQGNYGVDSLDGGTGDDTVTGGVGFDGMNGGDGNDVLDARDGEADFGLNCGAGSDTARYDTGLDAAIVDCETWDPPIPASAVRVTAGVMTYTAAAGQANSVTVTQDGQWVYLNDAVNLVPVAPCVPGSDAKKVMCPKSAITNVFTPVSVSLGDGNDFAEARGDLRVVISGDAGDDTFDGVVIAVGSNGPATFYGGVGYDRVLYSERTNAVSISLDDVANDGEAGEADNIASDVERIETGNGSDTITGSSLANEIYANGGNDTISGGGGDDYIEGNTGDDTINGNGGADNVQGNYGTDVVNGGTGNDTVIGGVGVDAILGDDGNDTLDARDNAYDFGVNCGTGVDIVRYDAGLDTAFTDCETYDPPR